MLNVPVVTSNVVVFVACFLSNRRCFFFFFFKKSPHIKNLVCEITLLASSSYHDADDRNGKTKSKSFRKQSENYERAANFLADFFAFIAPLKFYQTRSEYQCDRRDLVGIPIEQCCSLKA